MGAFEGLLELLDVHPRLPGGALLTVRATSRGWKFSTRTDAVTVLRLMVGCSCRDHTQFALHSGGIGGGAKLTAQGVSELQSQRAGKWNSKAFMAHVREAGERADVVSAALAQAQ